MRIGQFYSDNETHELVRIVRYTNITVYCYSHDLKKYFVIGLKDFNEKYHFYF